MQLSLKLVVRVLLLMVVINNTSAGISLYTPLHKAISVVATEVAKSQFVRRLVHDILNPLKNTIITSIQTLPNNVPEGVRPYVRKATNLLNVFTQVGPTVEEVESVHYYDISNDVAKVADQIDFESIETVSKGTKTDTTQSITMKTDGNSQNPQRNSITQADANKIIERLTEHMNDGFRKVEERIRQDFVNATNNINTNFGNLKNEMDKNTLALENFIQTRQNERQLNNFYEQWNDLISPYNSNVKKYLGFEPDCPSDSECIDELKGTENNIFSLSNEVDKFVRNHMTIFNSMTVNPTFFSIVVDLLNAQEARVCQPKGVQWRIYEEYLKIIISISDIMNFIIHVKINKFNRENNQLNISFNYENRKLRALKESLEIYKVYAENMHDVAITADTVINKASTVVRTCDPVNSVHVKDKTYQNFVRIQQGYIGSMDPEDPDDPFIEIEKNQYSTWVSVTNCTKLDEAIIFSESPTTQNMERYFDYAEEKGNQYGTKDLNKEYVSTKIEGDNVQKCIMKYEDEFSEHSIRFVSLQSKTTSPNYFVTGIRLKITNQILHLEIQQGKMLNGKIVNNTIHWLPSSKQTIYDKTMLVDVSKTNGFFMKDVTLPDGNFLTGVKFEVYNYKNDKKEEIQLIEIIVQGQNLTTQFNVSKENWLKGPNTQSLKEINLHNSDSSIKANINVVMSTPGQHYIPIQVTSMEKDAAQSMIPYLDIQDLYAPGLMPFRGIGMYYRGSEGFGGFIGLNAFSHKISDLIDLKKLDDGKTIVEGLINKVISLKNLTTIATEDLKSHKKNVTQSIINKFKKKNFK